jgi:hypothetical protein
LDHSEETQNISEDKFRKLIRSIPVALSITTVSEGRFLDVNAALECVGFAWHHVDSGHQAHNYL